MDHNEKNIGRLFPIKIGHYLLTDDTLKKEVEDIKSVGINRVKVIFKTLETANSLVNHLVIQKNNLIAYIPRFYTHKKGLIRMVDTCFDEEYLLNVIISNKKVVGVQRMKRKIIDLDGNSCLVKRQMIIVQFLGNEIPQNVQINLCNFQVEPYIQPMVPSYNCLRYGHSAKQCKSKESRCKKCTDIKHREEDCKADNICIYCKINDHPSVSRKCPVFIKQKQI